MKVSLYCLNEFVHLKDFFHQPQELANRLSMAGFEVEEWEDYYSNFDNIIIGQVKQKRSHPKADRLWLCQVQVSSSGTMVSIVCGADNFQEGDKVAVALPRTGVDVVLKGDGKQDLIKMQTRNIRGEMSQGMILAFNELFPVSAMDRSENLAHRFVSEQEDKKENTTHNLQPATVVTDSDDSGIMILPLDVKVGEPFAKTFSLNDILFKLNITPNRADCLSHFGLARELSCLLDRKMTKVSLGNVSTLGFGASHSLGSESTELKNSSSVANPSSKSYHVSVALKQEKLCSRYAGAVLCGVRVQPSPLWLKIRLMRLGFKPINNIVDVTNYLMIQRGQPLHAFDLDYLSRLATRASATTLTVDLASKGETFKALDGQELELDGTELCIRSSSIPVALAGVIGGMDSAIQLDTENIFIESACFDSAIVQQTSKKFRIETDSAYRFSRGVSSIFTQDVLQEALNCMQQLAGGCPAQEQYDLWPQKPKKHSIIIRQSDVERRLGQKLNFNKFRHWMERLFCELSPAPAAVGDQKSTVCVTIPFFRQGDLCVKEDLIEEYARLEGYDKIPEHIICSAHPRPHTPEYVWHSRIVDILVREGFYEAVNHDFISQQFSDGFLSSDCSYTSSSLKGELDQKKVQEQAAKEKMIHQKNNTVEVIQTMSYQRHLTALGAVKDAPVFIRNPLSAEYNMMRISLLPALFKNALHSLYHGSLQGRLFELGSVFFKSTSGVETHISDPVQNIPYQEIERMAFIAWGQKENLWQKTRHERFCVYDLKGVISVLLDRLGISDFEWVQLAEAPDFIHSGQFVILKIKGQNAGYAGSLHPAYAEKYKIRVDMAVSEWNLPVFQSSVGRKAFQTISRFPQMERDMAFWVPDHVSAGKLMDDLKKVAGPLCHSVKIFDVYKEDKEGQKRSIAFRLNWRAKEKTLTEKDITRLQDKIIRELSNKWPIRLR